MSEETAMSDVPRGARERLAAVSMPPRIAALPRDERGYPIPRFVDRAADQGGKPDFRVTDARYLLRCVRHNRCWICDEPLGRMMTFAIGPMCAVNRTSAEPPSHLECCRYSAKVCPFLAVPEMRRTDHNMPENVRVSGQMIARNPGAICLWTVRKYEAFSPAIGEILFEIGDPVAVEWWCRGRTATRGEVDASVESGLPLLRDAAMRYPNPDALQHLAACVARARQYLPAAA